MTKEAESRQVPYYGKKTYSINPLAALRKIAYEKVPVYDDEESETRQSRIINPKK